MKKKHSVTVIGAVVLVTVLLASHLNGQGDVDRFLFGKQKKGLQGSAGLNFMLLSGQADVISIAGTGSLAYLYGKGFVTLTGGLSYGESFDRPSVQKNYLQLVGGYKLSRLFAVEVLAFREHDKFECIRERYWIGGGIKMHLIKSVDPQKPSPFELTWGHALLYETEQFYDIHFNPVPGKSEFLKLVSVVSFFWKIKSNFSLSSSTYFLFALKDFKEHDIHTTIMLSTNLSKVLRFDTSLQYSYDNTVPPAAPKKYDLALTSGVSFKF